MDAVRTQKLISAYQSTLDEKKLEEFKALPVEKQLEVIQTQKFAPTDLGALSNLESRTLKSKPTEVFQNKPVETDNNSGLVLERTIIPSVNAKIDEPIIKKEPIPPKTTNYVVQLGDKIEDVVKKSLTAQGKEINEANIKEATEKLKNENHDFIRTSKKGDYLLAGKTIKLDGEINTEGYKTEAEVKTEYLKKHPIQESKTYTNPETKLKTTDTYNENKTIIKRVTKDKEGTITVLSGDDGKGGWAKSVETKKDGTVSVYTGDDGNGNFAKKVKTDKNGTVSIYTDSNKNGEFTKKEVTKKGEKTEVFTYDNTKSEWVNNQSVKVAEHKIDPNINANVKFPIVIKKEDKGLKLPQLVIPKDKFAGKPTKRSYSDGSIKIEEHYDVNKKMTSKEKKYMSGDVLTESYKNGSIEKKVLKTAKNVTTFEDYVDGKPTKTTRVENGEKYTYDTKEEKWVKGTLTSAPKKVNEPQKPTPKKGNGVVIIPDKYGNKTIETYKNGVLFQKEIIHKDGSKEFYDGYNPTPQGTYDFTLKIITDVKGHKRMHQRDSATGKYNPIR